MHVVLRSTGRLLAGLLLVLLTSRAFAQAPVITLQPVSQTNNVGALVNLSVEATGSRPLIFNWYFKDVQISSFTNGIISFVISSVLESGNYTAVVTNEFGATTSAPAVLTILGPPFFTNQPSPQAIYVTQTATFSAAVLSATPVTYQWLYQGGIIGNQTNTTLTLTNVTAEQAGFYSVQAQNQNGTTTSFAAQLTVLPLPPPSIRLGVLTATNQIQVPVLYTANSAETNISFSVTFDPTVFTNATFVPERLLSTDLSAENLAQLTLSRVRPAALPTDAVVITDESLLPQGRLGIDIHWVTNSLTPGESTIGQMLFDLVPGQTNPLAGLLGITNLPVPATFAPAIGGTNNIIINVMNPQLVSQGGFSLNLQTGLQQQVVTYGNPGNGFVENTRLIVDGLGFDSLTNVVRLWNSQGTLLIGLRPHVDLGAIAPTEVRQALMEYYVTDRVTTPTPVYTLLATPPVVLPVPNGATVADVVTRWTNGMVLVEFPTSSFLRYYIQYASNVVDFNNGAFNTSLPSMLGTGSRRQWLDTGPPRTLSPPVEGSRFYRVVEVP